MQPEGAFFPDEMEFPGTDNCFFTAGGVEQTLLKGRTGCTGVDLDPMDLGKV